MLEKTKTVIDIAKHKEQSAFATTSASSSCSILAMASTDADETQRLARQIKAFRKQFRRENGRDPSRKDMARHPDVAAVYKAWLTCVGGNGGSTNAEQSKAGPSRAVARGNESSRPVSASAIHTTRRHGENVQDSSKPLQAETTTLQASHPATPSKRKIQYKHSKSPLKTPHRTPSRNVEIQAAVNDSGGSIIDVPMTPQQQRQQRGKWHEDAQSPSEGVRQLQAGPRAGVDGSMRHGSQYDDATSPSKLRALIASFAATRSRLTPVRMQAAAQRAAHFAEDGEEELAFSDQQGGQNGRDGKDGALQNQLRTSRQSYTPRTKARKRLRGEVIVTPGKTPQRGTVDDQSLAAEQAGTMMMTPSKSRTRTDDARPVKKQRGMGSLRNFGFTSTRDDQSAGHYSQKQANGSANMSRNPRKLVGALDPIDDASKKEVEDGDYDDDDDDDDDDEVLGPSPSVRKIADVSANPFRPLFGSRQGEEGDSDDGGSDDGQIIQDMIEDQEAVAEPMEEDTILHDESSDDELQHVRAYERYSPRMRKTATSLGWAGNDDTEDGLTLPTISPLRHNQKDTDHYHIDNNDEHSLEDFRDMSLASPQCKRARQAERTRAAQRVRALLALDQNTVRAVEKDAQGDSAAGSQTADHRELSSGANEYGEKARTTAKMLAAPRGRGVHAGRAKAAAAQQHSIMSNGQAMAIEDAQATTRPRRLFLRRGREDDVESDNDAAELDTADEDDEFQAWPDESRQTRHGACTVRGDDSDEHWASDVGSEEYGLGDGVMDDYDVA